MQAARTCGFPSPLLVRGCGARAVGALPLGAEPYHLGPTAPPRATLTVRPPGSLGTRRCTGQRAPGTRCWLRSCSRRVRTSAPRPTCAARPRGGQGSGPSRSLIGEKGRAGGRDKAGAVVSNNSNNNDPSCSREVQRCENGSSGTTASRSPRPQRGARRAAGRMGAASHRSGHGPCEGGEEAARGGRGRRRHKRCAHPLAGGERRALGSRKSSSGPLLLLSSALCSLFASPPGECTAQTDRRRGGACMRVRADAAGARARSSARPRWTSRWRTTSPRSRRCCGR